jgi:hypothetical protein
MFTSLSSKTVMYPAAANFAVLRRELVLMVGTMWTSLAGWRTLCASSLMVLAAFLVPLGSWKIFLDVRPVGMNGSCLVPMWEVAALFAMMDGIEPLRTPFLMSCLGAFVLLTLLMLLGCLLISCSLTWQGGGAMSDKIE